MDVASRWNRIAVGFLACALGSMLGCGAMSSGSSAQQQSNSVSASSLALNFGTVVVGATSTLGDTIKNQTDTSITITAASASDAQFQLASPALPLTIAPGQSANVSISFKPRAAGKPSGNVVLAAGSQLSIGVSGSAVSAGSLSVTPSSLTFGNVQVGQSQPLTVNVTNPGNTSVSVTQASASTAAFALSGLTLPLSLAPGQSSTFTVTFTPTASGQANGSISLSGTASLIANQTQGQTAGATQAANASLSVSGQGVAAGQLSEAPGNLNFGTVQVGTTQTQTITLSNPGSSSLTISQATASGAGFNVSGLSLPATLAAGQSANLSVSFNPQSAGNVTGAVSITSSASNSSMTVSLAGTGAAAGALVANPSSLSFGSVLVGSSQSLSSTLTNSGSTSITISQATASGSGFSVSGLTLPATVAAGKSVNFTVTFAPKAAGTGSGNVAFTSTASNATLNVPLSGTGTTPGTLVPNPASLSFGSIQVGNNKTMSETISNSGGATVNITQATVTGAGFSMSGLSVPTTLASGKSLTFTVKFAPQNAGNASGNIAITSNASNSSLSVGLTGSATSPGQLSLTPATQSYGNVTVGQNKALTGTLTASGGSVTISSATSNSAEFVVSGLSLPTTLSSGQSATFTVTFAPSASGAASGTMTFASNATNGSKTQSVSGTGVAAQSHTVALNWGASSSSVIGYNVYRGTVSGGPYAMVNASTDTATTYSDASVQSGQTYYYVVTALDSQGVESAFSNQVTAVVPTP